MDARRFLISLAAVQLLSFGAGAAHADARWTSPPYLSTPPLVNESDAELESKVTAMSTFPTVLDERLWVDDRMRPEIRAKVMEVINDLFAELRLKDVTISGVEVRGSNTSYEYDDDADLGVKVLLDTSKYHGNAKDLADRLKLFNAVTEMQHEGQIILRGMPLEVNFYASRDERMVPQKGIGHYSITADKWIEKPTVQKDQFDRNQMAADTKRFVTGYNDLVAAYFNDKQSFDCRRFRTFSREMSKYRDAGIKASGTRSTENLTFRLLRRLSVNVITEVDDLALECRNIHWSL
jgi:hypothetical protein